METSEIRTNVKVDGDLETTLGYDTLGRFLDTDPNLVHFRVAHRSKGLTAGRIIMPYDNRNRHHLIPVSVEMSMQRNGSVEEVVTMYLSPVASDLERSKAEISRIGTNLENFLRSPQSYITPTDQLSYRTQQPIIAINS